MSRDERRRVAREKAIAEQRAREERRKRRQERQHRALLEAAIADKPPSPGERGTAAEDRAVAALVAEGYAIVHRNWRADIGELDVVARDGHVLVFVEVRSRDDDEHGHAAEMVTRQKQRRVARVAQVYLVVERPAYRECRFDVVAVTGDVVDIIKDAWRT